MTVRRRLLLSGRVQGVFFRDSCRRIAERERVAGFARNLADGRLEIALEGEEDAVERVIEWCRDGPPLASVTSVEISEEEPAGESRFSVTSG